MQKKSLLVALFCGALCLTGCLKNEESASVTQVRIAKANELNSIAELNKAKAQAEVIYATAESTLKNAQAELEKANAALVLAQAETEKVKAQLLGVQVKLAEVKVEEEKVKLQMMQADLESRLAYLEAEKAAAEAAKQAWVNVLSDLLAQAEINAIENAQSLLEAEEALQDYVLSKAGEKVDSAKYYAGLYFATLREIEKLQVQELEAKAARVLVNQGAILTREYLYEEIEANNDTIAQNNAVIEALKENQTLTPEEAEEALKEARKTLNEAYTAYRLAKEAEGEIKDAFDAEWTKTSDFEKFFGDTPTVQGVSNLMPGGSGVRPGFDFLVGRGDFDVDIIDHATAVVGRPEPRSDFGFVRDHSSIVEIDGVSVTVSTAGLNVRTDDGFEFIPFWNEEATDTVHTRYPDVDVYQKNHSDHLHLSNVVIAPATIYYDNIKTALDKVVEREEARAENNIARKERGINREIARLERQIKGYEDSIKLHQAYVDARRAEVEEAEEAYIMAVAAAKASRAAIGEAWEAFQEHMLLEHPTVSRSLFAAHFWADTLHRWAVSDTVEALNELNGVKEGLDDNKAAVKAAFEALGVAKGVYQKAIDSLFDGNPEKQTAAEKAAAAYKAACGDWDPDFANVATETNVTPRDPAERQDDGYWFYRVENEWKVTPDGADAIWAGSTQDSTLTAKYNKTLAEQNLYKAEWDVSAGVQGAAEQKAKWSAEVTKWTAKVSSAQGNQDAAWIIFYDAYGAYYDVLGFFPEHMFDAYNPDFDVLAIATFPTDAGYGTEGVYIADTLASHNYYNKKTGKWSYNGKPAGSAQADLLNAVLTVMLQEGAIEEANEDFEDAKDLEAFAQNALTTADQNLIAALKGVDAEDVDMEEEDIEDYLDEDDIALYVAYLESYKDVKDADEAWAALQKAYAPYPDEVGALRPYDAPFARFHNFGWMISSYNVDYEATYINKDGKERSIARFLNGRRHGNPYARSLQYKVDQAQEKIDEDLPEELAQYIKEQNDNVKAKKDAAATAMAKVNAYKTYESGYQNWVKERDAVEEVYNAAKIARYDAYGEFQAAQAIYDAVNAIVNEGMFIYDPNSVVYDRFKEVGATRDWRGFTLVPVASAIELLEEENEELEARNEFIRNVLHDGKKVLSVVNEIIDQKIAVISDNIQIMVAIAAEYRGIMNAYLGIVDEEVAGETGPLDGEGDDEE